MSSIGERGPTGDHGQAGDPGRAGEQGKRGYAGPEGQGGLPGERGQSGDAGQTGATGARGEKGEKGVTPLVVRKATGAYLAFFVGIILFVCFSQWQERQDDERDSKTMARFEAEAVATDRAFCAFFNYITSSGLNPNRDAIRSLVSAVRESFEMVQPAPGSPPDVRRRTDDFRNRIIARIDQVEINGNFPPLDCAGIGNGEVDFSLQDAIRDAMAALPTPPTTTPG